MSLILTHRKKPSRFYASVLALYLVLSVVNWLPFIDNNLVRFFKYFTYVFIFLYEVNHFKIRYPSNYLSVIGLILILLSMIPGLVLSMDFNALIDIFIPFTVIWILNYKKEFYYDVLYRASLTVAIICFLSIFSAFTGIMDFQANGPWFSSFSAAGFGGYPTGYSNSLFLFIPFIVYKYRIANRKIISKETVIILIIISAQYISGGRAGLLASLFVIFIGFRASFILKVFLIILIAFAFQSENVQRHFRITNAGKNRYERNLDEISSGRLYLDKYYYEKFLKRPLFGYGFGEKEEMELSLDAHIIWLRNVVDGGLIYFFFLLYFFIEIFKKIRNNFTLKREERKFFYILFFSTLIITFLEPNYLIGSVQGEFVYWFLISLLLKRERTISNPSLNEKMLS